MFNRLACILSASLRRWRRDYLEKIHGCSFCLMGWTSMKSTDNPQVLRKLFYQKHWRLRWKGAGGVGNKKKLFILFEILQAGSKLVNWLAHWHTLFWWNRKDGWNEEHRGKRGSLRYLLPGLQTHEEMSTFPWHRFKKLGIICTFIVPLFPFLNGNVYICSTTVSFYRCMLVGAGGA